MRVEDKNLNRVQQVEYDLAERPMQKTIRDLETEELIYRTTLQYDGKNRLKDFSEQTAEGSHRTSYTYDKDDRTTAIQYDDAEHKVEYTYDALNRITARKVTNGTNAYETKYGYVAGNTTKYGAGATTPLISTITQGADANAMNFAYEYDSQGNIVSENRNGDVTTYSYDALGQLIRVNDPHENATWVYNYDRGGNITSKVKYAYTTGTLGTAQQTIPYEYDTVWKDKLVKYDGKSITYDAIGNPLNDGERKYTWSAGRQLKKIALPATVSESMNTTDGVDANSNARLKIVFSNSNVLQNSSAKTTASAHVYEGAEEITANIPAANFTWVKVAEDGTITPNWRVGVKSVSLTQTELSGATEIRCEVTRTSEYGTVQVDNSMMASHTPAVDDANDVFSIENGNLMLDTTDTENLYKIENNCLKVEAGLGVDLTAKAVVYPELPDKVVEFRYNSEGLRTQKKVILPNGKATTTEYILHGKLITEMRKGQDVLHFFYDTQSRPASVEYNGKIYTYVHNQQGDVVGILDSAGNLVVEYKYDAWGRPVSTTGTLASTLGKSNPYRYRGYVYDEEIELYYLRSRYYCAIIIRFLNTDLKVYGIGPSTNVYCYCNNCPTKFVDSNGCEGTAVAPAPSRSEDWYETFEWNYYFVPSSTFYYGEPNSYRAWKTPKGEWYERWYDSNGLPKMDRHWTDHGNRKEHPFVPHDEDWKDNGKGGKTLDPKSSRPSPKDAQKPSEETGDHKFSLKGSDTVRDILQGLVFVVGVGIFILSSGSVKLPRYS